MIFIETSRLIVKMEHIVKLGFCISALSSLMLKNAQCNGNVILSGVEESAHLDDICSEIGAKSLCLAQDDKEVSLVR